MKKTLVLAAAALTAGMLTASAQSNVYSLNIVGYVNEVYKGNGAFTLAANPLDNTSGGNNITNLFASLAKNSVVQVWNGGGYDAAQKSTATAWNTNFVVLPGGAVFVKTPSGSADVTNTFVGNVVGSPASTNLPANTFMFLGSLLPIGGSLNDTNFNLGQSLTKNATVQVWNNSGAGGFDAAQKSTATTWNTNLTIAVGQGFFVKAVTATNWVQTLPPSP